jgi:broad specificity phosphatase PhoE
VGDPAGFRLGDCSTQRNLSAQGRAQARAIGARFRDHGIERAAVHSSRWCRALETAELLALGPVSPFPGLDSFFTDRSAEGAQLGAIRKLAASHPVDAPPLVLVTHQVNITALSGVYPASGEIVVMRVAGDTLIVAGRIRTGD